jgi:hypothetical protein
MSANLMWEPAKRPAESLPDALKFVLRDRYGLEHRQTFGRNQVPYLQGLADANIEGALELLEAIEKHESVELWLEY